MNPALITRPSAFESLNNSWPKVHAIIWTQTSDAMSSEKAQMMDGKLQ